MSETMQGALPVEVVSRFLKSAPVDLDAMASALGLKVGISAFEDPEVAGNIERTGDGYRISLNAHDPARRQRFTLAHEIGHYILHRDLIGDGITDRGLYRSRLTTAIERQANRYAANLLMPAQLVFDAWHEGVNSLPALSARFNVSEKAAEIRLDELGLR